MYICLNVCLYVCIQSNLVSLTVAVAKKNVGLLNMSDCRTIGYDSRWAMNVI